MTTDNARRTTEVDRGKRTAVAYSAESPPRTVAQRILIVEDEPRLREMLVANVVEMGLEPSGASSAESALKILDQQMFAIAVVDLNLPGMGGMDLCERVRQRWPLIQLIILTGFGDLDSAKRAIRMEAVDFLTKPCGMDNLEAALGRARLRWLERWLTVADYRNAPAEQAELEAPETIEATRVSTPLSLDDMERKLIFAALARHNGSRESAATELGISVRKLYYRLRQYQQRGLVPDA
jgi:DNA-binding NtrC family response regulator